MSDHPPVHAPVDPVVPMYSAEPEARGVYYTPPHILRWIIMDPASGSGAWLADLASNPPYGDGDA